MCPVAPRDIRLRSSSGIGVSDAQTHLHFELQPQDSAYIECSATGTLPLRICWSLAADAEVQTPPATNGRLELWSAGVDTEADFVCSASNSINGQTRTANRTVTVTIWTTTAGGPEVTSTGTTGERGGSAAATVLWICIGVATLVLLAAIAYCVKVIVFRVKVY